MFDDVLIATDGSECGMHAARAGVEFADTFDATVTVVVAANDELSLSEAERIAAEVSEMGAGSQRTVQTQVVEDTARRAILEVADDRDVDVVVMGRRGHTGIQDRLLGSVTERVLRSGDYPVLTVPRDATVGGYEDVLVPTDGSDASRAAIRPGTSIAMRYDAVLHLLSVVDVSREGGVFNAGGVDQAFVERLKADAREDLNVFEAGCEEAVSIQGADDGVDEEATAELDVETMVRTGTPSTEIAAYVEEASLDMVVIASRGESSLAGQLLGSTTSRLLRIVDEPTLVVVPN